MTSKHVLVSLPAMSFAAIARGWGLAIEVIRLAIVIGLLVQRGRAT